MKLKICLIGDMSGNIDEGMKKVTYNIFTELSRSNEVLVIKPLEIISKKGEINKFNPDIIHYITGPSIYSFILLKLAKIGLKNVKTIISITHPRNLNPEALISLFKPDLILVQAHDMEIFFKRFNSAVDYFPNGVDIKKFKPIDNKKMKMELREKYGIGNEKFVVLHVGNLQSGRNVDLLKELSKSRDIQVLVVSSTTIKANKQIYDKLLDSKIKIIDYYVKNIENIYNLSDLYVFPAANRPFAIDVPLSVMEAMACNLPVVSRRFAGLPIFFSEGDGLVYANNNEEIIYNVLSMKGKVTDNSLKVRTREKTLPYYWESVCKRLETVYIKLIREGG